jgi:hypothetical protein
MLMSTNLTSRTGLRPFVKKRTPGTVKISTRGDVAEFEALMRVMKEAHFDSLGKFYGGAQLNYDRSVAQKILVAAVRQVGEKLSSVVNKPQSPGASWVLERAKGLARLVMKHESAYLIDGFYPDSADTFTKAHTEPKECPCRRTSVTATTATMS